MNPDFILLIYGCRGGEGRDWEDGVAPKFPDPNPIERVVHYEVARRGSERVIPAAR